VWNSRLITNQHLVCFLWRKRTISPNIDPFVQSTFLSSLHCWGTNSFHLLKLLKSLLWERQVESIF
jgi:hypothetical protein